MNLQKISNAWIDHRTEFTSGQATSYSLICSLSSKRPQEPDVKKSVLALHLAVNKLCPKNISFRRWVPFIHILSMFLLPSPSFD